MKKAIFKRYENKYLITQEQYAFIMPLLLNHVQLDEYCQDSRAYSVHNIYFDTNNNSIIRQSLDKPVYKEKLRLRSYTDAFTDDGIIFLELKKKFQGIVYKRRVDLTYREAMDLVFSHKMPQRDDYLDDQVIKEIAYFIATHDIKRRIFINYQRCAMTGIDQPDLRITIDKDIYFHYDNEVSDSLLPDNTYLMEIKTENNLPLWLVNTLSAMQIYKVSFSKYGKIYTKTIVNDQYHIPASEAEIQLSMKGRWQYV